MQNQNHTYRGVRAGRAQPEGPTTSGIALVSVDGQLLPRSHWAQQTSSDYEWGYAGTGPRALAHALLAYELGAQVADELYAAFEQEVIAALPRDRGGEEWTLTSQQIRDWWSTRRLLAQALAPLEATDSEAEHSE